MFCSRTCQTRQLARAISAGLVRALGARIEPAWSIAICSCAAAMLLLVVGTHLATLLEVSTPRPDRDGAAAAPVSGRWTPDGDGWRLEVTGPRNGTVLVVPEGRPPVTVALDRRGRATVRDVELRSGTSAVQLTVADGAPSTVPPAVTPTPADTPTVSPVAAAHTPATPPATSTPRRPPTVTPGRPPSDAHEGPPSTREVPSEDDQRASRSAPPVLHLVGDAGPRIAITFDGAVSANGTPELLDLLGELDLRVTLFVTGEFIDRYPALVRRALLAGHEVGNHTYSHQHLTSYATNRRHQLLDHVTREWLHAELRRTEEAFRRATGRHMAPLWRAPFGEENRFIRGWAMELGYLHVRWSSLRGTSLDSLDWVDDEHSPMYRDSERTVDRLLRFPKLEGGIVLMHLASERPDPPWNGLPRFLESLQARGLVVVTVGELLENSDTWRRWLERAAARHRGVFPPAADPDP